MKGHHFPVPYLRLVAPTMEQTDRRILRASVTETAGTELDRALAHYVQAGRDITAAAAAVVLATAAAHGLVWNTASVWDGLTDIVSQMLHEDLVDNLSRSGIDAEVAARHLAQRYGRNE